MRGLIMLFLGIEILSIPIYVLAGSKRESLASNEAALKYFITGAFASAILLFGTALIYGATGTFDITKIVSSESKNASLFFPGLLMIPPLRLFINYSVTLLLRFITTGHLYFQLLRHLL